MTVHLNGLGSQRCLEWLASGRQCPNLEVEGMEFCLKHMPAEMLDEAEAITGVKRCRNSPAGEFACHDYAAEGTYPPACVSHKPAAKARKHLAVINGQATELAMTIVTEHALDLENAPAVNDPYGELMAVTGELRVWKDIVRAKVGKLERLGYAGKTGEQQLAEVQLYTQALRDLSSVLLSIGRLNLDARLIGIRQQTVEMMDRALDRALEEAGVDYGKKTEARRTFLKHLKVVA
jgi:hypothetical protein